MLKNWLGLLEKLFIILLSISVVVYILMVFNFWAAGWKDFFLGQGDIKMFIYITLFLFALAYIFKKLLIWEVHLTLGKPKKRRR